MEGCSTQVATRSFSYFLVGLQRLATTELGMELVPASVLARQQDRRTN